MGVITVFIQAVKPLVPCHALLFLSMHLLSLQYLSIVLYKFSSSATSETNSAAV